MPDLAIETKLWVQGYQLIAGIDEVGRGCLLGSVLAAAVVLPVDCFIPGVDDSKRLSAAQRERLYPRIAGAAIGIGIGLVDCITIDAINIKAATREAMRQAAESMSDRDGAPVRPDYLLVDAEPVAIDLPQHNIIKGDSLCHSIAAASIIAKVTRDRLCLEWDQLYPQYRIASNKGYGTAEHIAAIMEYGPCPLHRRSFIRHFLGPKGEEGQ